MENYECSSASSYSTGYSGHDVFSDASSGILEDRILEASTAHSSFETPDCLSGYNNALFSADPTHGVYDEPVKFDDDLTIPHRGSVNAYARNNNPYLRFEPDWQQMSHISFPWNVDEARMPTPQPRSLQPSEDSKLGLPAGGYPFCDEDLFGGRVDLRSISYDPSTPIERLQIVDPRATAFEQVWPSADQGVLIEKSNLPSHFQSRSPRNLPTTKVPDGVRKKNARFAIPEGRNLETIDRMITEAPTETLAKELKQQKRLLRNRQAA